MRLAPNQRKEKILQSALLLAKKVGHLNITVSAIARQSKISRPLIYKHFENLYHLQIDVYRYAVLNSEFDILKHCVSNPNVKMPHDLKHKTLQFMAT